MKIVVLAGGLSPERNVSLSTGCMVAEALKGLGHQVAFVDMFFGVEGSGALEALFDGHVPEEARRVSREAPDLEKIRASRPDGGRNLFGPRVLELCAMADLVFIALHGTCGEDGRVQAAFDLMGIPYTGAGYLGCWWRTARCPAWSSRWPAGPPSACPSPIPRGSCARPLPKA